MSGPITVVVTTNPIAALLSAAAIEALAAIRDGYAEADALAARDAASRAATQSANDAARRQGEGATEAGVDAAEQRFANLEILARQLGVADQMASVRPTQPNEAHALAVYAADLSVLADQMEPILLDAAARLRAQQDVAGDDLAVPEARKTLAQRQLERIAHLGEIPEDIAHLAQRLEAALPGQQAEMLATELRRAVQLRLEQDEKQRVQVATGIIVEQTLKDMGYQVEEIAHTLFVEGGVVHFQRADWGDYMVRMRVDATAGSINFNVIRAVAAGDNARSVLDHVAEDRWCAEFPALLRALEARGVSLNVTRRLAAGELPVQLVERSRLPEFAQMEEARTHTKAISKEIK